MSSHAPNLDYQSSEAGDLSSAGMARNLPLGDLLALGAQLCADITPEELMQETADAIHDVLGYAYVYVRLRNADTDALEACAFAGFSSEHMAFLQAHPTPPGAYQHMLQPCYSVSESYFIPADQMARFAEQPPIGETSGTLLIPLRARSDRIIGVIYVVAHADPRTQPLGRVQQVEVIARQAALSLENVRLANRAARLLEKEQLLVDLGRDVSNTLELDAILAKTVQRLQGPFQSGSIALLDEHDELAVTASFGTIDAEAQQVRLRTGEGISGWVLYHGLPFLSNDIAEEIRVKPVRRNAGTNRLIRSYIAVPMRSGGKIIGTLSVEADHANAFTFEDVDILEAVAAQIGGPIASARLYQEAQRLAAQVEQRNEQLTVLNTIARTAISTVNLDWMLATVVNQIQHGFDYDYVELYLVNEDSQTLVLAARAGEHISSMADYSQSVQDGLIGRAYRTGQAVRVDDVQHEHDYLAFSSITTRSELCVPISTGGRVLAVLNLEAEQISAFTDDDVSVLQTAADMLAGAIESARRYRRAQEAAVLEERSRLARDLHDSISQQLFSMTLTAQAARAQLDKQPERAAGQLERLQETATAAMTEMRALIFQLRPPSLAEQGLVSALQRHIAALGRREELTVSLSISGEERNARGVDLALYRITQEALNNVVRHAGAQSVTVELDMQPDVIILRISDDGHGFDPLNPTSPNGQHLGLTSMRERAAELNGTLDVRSVPGQGTDIVVTIPGRDAKAQEALERHKRTK
ncbi:MAG TPA: GAF domain-containing protein [Roseiflexaceae bacterium]|nr:GAF domain-containing protein [Roseiflexaceae bacterium]